jgi:CRP-like cAMP-binding protein
MATAFPEIGERIEELGAAAEYRFDDEQFARAAAYGEPDEVTAGEVLYHAGDEGTELILVDTAAVDIVRTATEDAPEESFLRFGPGQFLGELNVLTGQVRILTARVVQTGRIHRIGPEGFRRLMAQDSELSDVFLRAFVAHDQAGFIPTDLRLRPDDRDPRYARLGRDPLPFETSAPGVFAVGDVRLASMKRVAAAVGEGASAVRSVHQALAHE